MMNLKEFMTIYITDTACNLPEMSMEKIYFILC